MYVYKGTGIFTQDDYQKVAKADQIRNASDYDDFYIASKKEASEQIEDAEDIIKKVEQYLLNSQLNKLKKFEIVFYRRHLPQGRCLLLLCRKKVTGRDYVWSRSIR